MGFACLNGFLPFSGYYPRKAGKVLLPIKHSEHIR